MAKRVNKIKEKQTGAVLYELDIVNDDHRMVNAVKKRHQKSFENPTISNDESKTVTSSQEVHKIIQNHFKNYFHKEDVNKIEKHVGEPKPLPE